jgi:hypothetical protein
MYLAASDAKVFLAANLHTVFSVRSLGSTVSLSDNQWTINNTYAAGVIGSNTPNQPSGITGSPNSYYMHIFSAVGVSSGFYSDNDAYDATGDGLTFFAAQTTPISSFGYTNVYFSFWWICNGDAQAVGKVYYRTASSGAWTQITLPVSTFHGSSSWTKDSVHLPEFDNQPTLEFGFQFSDGTLTTGSDPAFGVDDINVYVPATTSVIVDSFTTTSSTSCIDSCITVTNASTGGIVDSVRWFTSPAGPLVAAPTSFSTPICFSSAGLYNVTLQAYSGGVPYTSTQLITVIPTPTPNITQLGNVLSVGSGYTSYQWYTGLTPIPGANTNTYTMPATGIYGVVVDSGGCPGFDSLTVTSLTLYAGNVQSLSSAHFWVSQPDKNNISLNSSMPLTDELAIVIYDATGRKIVDDKWNAGSLAKQVIGLSLTPGLYIIKLSNNYTSSVIKWIKQ